MSTNYEKLAEEIGKYIIYKYKNAGREEIQHASKCPMFVTKDTVPIFHIDKRALGNAAIEAKKDVLFMLERRKDLIGDNGDSKDKRPSQGKISGVIAYRLSKAKIFHLCDICLDKCENTFCSIKALNIYYPLIVSLDYMGINYHDVPEEIRKEIIYSILYRHTNQETLGLVFDILLWYNNKI